MTSPETVEQLSEQIVSQYVGGAYLSGCARDCREQIEEWLRSHGIDPAGMGKDIAEQKATCGEQLAEAAEEFLQGMGEPVDDKPTPPAEPEVRDGDRELADRIIDAVMHNRVSLHDASELLKRGETLPQVDIPAIIADHLAAERAEADSKVAGLQVERDKWKSLYEKLLHHMDHNLYGVLQATIADLKSQLAATEAKLREAEGRVKHVELCQRKLYGEIESLRDAALTSLDFVDCWKPQPQPTNAESE